MDTTVPGKHENRIEARIKTIKARERSILARLPHVPPAKIMGELRANVIESLNMTANSQTNGLTPLELVTGRKPDFSQLAMEPWGTPAIFYEFSSKGHEPRGEYGIIVGWHKGTKGAVRAYFPDGHRATLCARMSLCRDIFDQTMDH